LAYKSKFGFSRQFPSFLLQRPHIIPTHAFAATVKGGANNNTLILYGGRNLTNAENMSLLIHIKRRILTALIDYNGKCIHLVDETIQKI